MFGNSCQHLGTDLVLIVEPKTKSGDPCRASVRWDPDSRLIFQPMRRNAASTRRAWWPASGSRRLKRDREGLCWGFAVLQSFRQHAQREGLDMSNGFGAGLAVAQSPRQRRDLGQPAAILFAVEFDVESQRRH